MIQNLFLFVDVAVSPSLEPIRVKEFFTSNVVVMQNNKCNGP